MKIIIKCRARNYSVLLISLATIHSDGRTAIAGATAAAAAACGDQIRPVHSGPQLPLVG